MQINLPLVRMLHYAAAVAFFVRPASAAVEYTGEFAPSPALVASAEKPYREAISLNGTWQFQPQEVPAGFVPGSGVAPKLADPLPTAWEPSLIKIPSPWNVNTWGAGRDVGEGTARPFWPDSVYYPSYPASWDLVKMGWLQRNFTPPLEWKGRRVILHFDAVAGDCEVRVNGKVVGSHFDKYLPFDLDVTDAIRLGRSNELSVGVRSHELFNKHSARFGKMIAPYPTGSETTRLAGIWQDVSIHAVPDLRVADAFVKPRVKDDILELEVTLRNDRDVAATVNLGASVSPWIGNQAPSPEGSYGDALLESPAHEVTIAAGSLATVKLEVPVKGKLKHWAPGSPNLHGVHLTVSEGGKAIDLKTTRFGWREFSIQGKDLLLNGEKIQLFGDLLHPFGPLIMSRRHTWAWYKLVQDFGGNAVRPHAQIYPKHYLDLADEMGIVVLDETALFGSSVALNFEEPVAWERFEKHVDGLVLRDRNHPSVLGWSFGNELFAIFHLNNVPGDLAAEWYAKLADLGARALKLDPTRQWISCDGDDDLRGRLPVWSKHFGLGDSTGQLPELEKPLMVGESGGSYYARPSQLAVFNGERAFENYSGRNEALAIDVYDNIVKMARPHLAYFSASETAWFGVEHLGYGYRDLSRLPGKQDGVFFTRPYEEGKPGMQPERIPPFVDTLNPGWDPELPLYKPLAMFEAVKAALAQPQPAPIPWQRGPLEKKNPAVAPPPISEQVGFVGKKEDPLAKRLLDLGIPLGDNPSFMIIDASSATAGEVEAALASTKKKGGKVFFFAGSEASASLPAGLKLVARKATMLVPDHASQATASLGLPDLYFAEDGADRFIMQSAIAGDLPAGARTLLQASDTDWSLFNNAPEFAKCAAVVLHEKLRKPAAAALIEVPWGGGRLYISSLDYRIASSTADSLWRQLFTNLGVKIGEPAGRGVPAFDREGVLVNALSVGRFPAPDLATALGKDFIGESSATPAPGMKADQLVWQAVTNPSRDRFQLHELKQDGPKEGTFATYFSFWIRSPRGLDDLLADGPDAPRFTMHCYVSSDCRLFVNGTEHSALRKDKADYRQLVTFDGIPLKKGWNRMLIKVAADQLEGTEPATLAVRISSTHADYLRQLDSTIELKEK